MRCCAVPNSPTGCAISATSSVSRARSRRRCASSRSWWSPGSGPRITNGTRTASTPSPPASIPRFPRRSKPDAARRSCRPDEALVYDLVSELLIDKDISDATYEAAKARFGERTIVELIGTAGYYGFVSLVLNAARTPVPDGGTRLPRPAAR